MKIYELFTVNAGVKIGGKVPMTCYEKKQNCNFTNATVTTVMELFVLS